MTLRLMADLSSPADQPRVESDCAIENGGQRVESDSVMEGKGNEGLRCKVCLDRYIDLVLIPCRHAQICGICSRQLKRCPVCRKDIVATLDIYL